mgnify:CR=1 FL=1|tara:strand:- start:5264 stop:5704 length:441 start_codon:yes stop_codon:yes gene_type:complete
MSQLEVDKLIPQSGTALQIGDASDTITIPANATFNASSATVQLPTGVGGTSWQTVKTNNFTAVAGEGYFINTTGGVITATLPASATIGNEISIIDYAGTADTNNITIGRNGHKIQGATSDMTVTTERAAFTLVYVDATQGWLLKDK